MREVTLMVAIECVQEVLEHKYGSDGEIELSAATSLDSLNFDSLDVALLYTTLEDRVGVELDPDSTAEIKTIGDLASLRPLAPAALVPELQ